MRITRRLPVPLPVFGAVNSRRLNAIRETESGRSDSPALKRPSLSSQEAMPLRPAISEDIRTPIDHEYSAAELIEALPARGRVDPTTLSAALVAKAAAHHDDLSSIGASSRAQVPDPRRGVLRHVLLGALLAAVIGVFSWVIVAGTGAVAEAIYDMCSELVLLGFFSLAHPWVLMWTGAAVGAVGWGCERFGWRLPRSLPLYTDDELCQLESGVAAWPEMAEDLDGYANSEALHEQWAQRWRWSDTPGAAALVWREPHLVAIAALICGDIANSRAWRSELFDLHRIRIDLDQTLIDIHLRAHRIWSARANLIPVTGELPDDPVRRRNDDVTAAADDAWSTLVELVRQLQDYQRQIAPIDAMLTDIEALQLSAMRIPDAAVQQLFVDAANNEAHAGQITNATAELAELNANLEARLHLVREALGQPASVLPVSA